MHDSFCDPCMTRFLTLAWVVFSLFIGLQILMLVTVGCVSSTGTD